MNQIKCPNCGTIFQVSETDYESILKQVKNEEFEKDLNHYKEEFLKEKESTLELLKTQLEKEFEKKLNEKNLEIQKLANEIERKEEQTKGKIETEYIKQLNERDLKIQTLKNELEIKEEQSKNKIEQVIHQKELETKELQNQMEQTKKEQELKIRSTVNNKEKQIETLTTQSQLQKQEFLLKEKNLKETFEEKIKDKEEQIAYYKDFKARQSTKMLGESLESHCSMEFNQLRPLFQKAYFEKDNTVSSSGSKGDFIFRDFDEDEMEFVSIMFEMKNEADKTATKHKNEDFLKELDKDRREKNCEYAVLVSLLEMDNDYYNNGIVDMSHKYPKMYVIRPQFFIPIITLIRSLAENTIKYKKELQLIQNQNIDISHFEEDMQTFKDSFGKNYRIASEKFKKAIEEIDKTIDHLQKSKDALLSSENNLRIANRKAEELSIKKLTHHNETMKKLFEEQKETVNQ